ncbi:MAG: tRNA lysidine(34) synthetase TilS [Pseudomonadota bacterium]
MGVSEALERHEACLLAVSGGGDSMALLGYVAEILNAQRQSGTTKPTQAWVATVDHGLRPEAKQEAVFVAKEAQRLGFCHTTLTLDPSDIKSENLREARYARLVEHAKTVGAQAIFLGHTLDDQAETLVMRAKRATPASATRGLSGIPARATHDGIVLERPLLNTGRQTLRAWLTARGTQWLDDPTNENPAYERARTRMNLTADDTAFPSALDIARLADLTARSRAWLNAQSAHYIINHTTLGPDALVLDHGSTSAPKSLLMDVYAYCVLVVGGQARRVARSKLESVVAAHRAGCKHQSTAGHTVISVQAKRTEFRREWRGGRSPDEGFDLLQATWPGLIRFRPACDDAIMQAFNRLKDKTKHQSSR